MSRNWITIEQAADQLGTSQRSIRRYIAEGRLTGYRVAGVHLIRLDQEEVDQLLEPIPTYTAR